jgi:hypothetical protein
MYPVFQFCVTDGLTFAIVPVPAIDASHAEMRVRSFCAVTNWRVVDRCAPQLTGCVTQRKPWSLPVVHSAAVRNIQRR